MLRIKANQADTLTGHRSSRRAPSISPIKQTPEPKTSAVRFSVLMPACGQAAFISRALNSLRAQTLQQRELVSIDDGSTDNATQLRNEHRMQQRRDALWRVHLHFSFEHHADRRVEFPREAMRYHTGRQVQPFVHVRDSHL